MFGILHRYLIGLIIASGIYLFLPFEVDTELGQHILISIKLPIFVTSLLVGFALCSASASLQVLLKNPLADPGIIGIASGASAMAAIYFALIGLTGTSLGFLLSPLFLSVLLPLMCFLGALISGLLIFRLAKRIGFATGAVILSGIAISTLFAALIAWLYILVPPMQLQSLTFWLMGSLNNTNWLSLSIASPVILLCLLYLYKSTTKLNWLFFGTDLASIKGLETQNFQKRLMFLSAILVGIAVSIAGSIAFIGLIIPHLLRQIHGNDNRLIVPLSGFCGAICLVFCAIVNEHVVNSPLPVSLITASLGAPLFVWILLKGANRSLK